MQCGVELVKEFLLGQGVGRGGGSCLFGQVGKGQRSFPFEGIEAFVSGDGEEPGGETAASRVKGFQLSIGGEEYVLSDVFAGVMVIYEIVDHCDYRFLIPLHELAKGLYIAP